MSEHNSSDCSGCCPPHGSEAGVAAVHRPRLQPEVAKPKIKRNAPCPCGSERKYKKCCGAAKPSKTQAKP